MKYPKYIFLSTPLHTPYQAVFVPIGPCVHGSQWPGKANDVPKGALKYRFLVSSLNVFLLKNHLISNKNIYYFFLGA